eukprot:COSAG02_NODE_71849_length_189_cov_34.744444_1_plen_58_part_01
MFTAIETIKDGYAYDDRYNFKDVWFDSPWVLSSDAMSARGPGGTDGTSTGNKWFVSGE